MIDPRFGIVAFRATSWMLRFAIWPFTIPRAKAVIICDEHVLVVKQWFGEQKWEIPGGGIHRGETPFAAARREIDEEVGLELDELSDYGTYHVANRASVWHVIGARMEKKSLLLITRPQEILAAKWLPLSRVNDEDVDKTVADLVEKVVATPDNKQ